MIPPDKTNMAPAAILIPPLREPEVCLQNSAMLISAAYQSNAPHKAPMANGMAVRCEELLFPNDNAIPK